jgi:hypothetical protein
MPILNFRFNSIQFSAESDQTTETQTLRANASVIIPKWRRCSFLIEHEGRKYNGYAGTASIVINQRLPRNILPGVPTEKPWEHTDEHRDIMRVDFYGAPGSEAFYQITLSTHQEVYRRIIEADLRTTEICVALENETLGQALEYGADPEGTEIVWNADSSQYVFLQRVTFLFTSTAEANTAPPAKETDEPRIQQLLTEKCDAVKSAIDHLSMLTAENTRVFKRGLLSTFLCLLLILIAILFR